jgi:hypothetical protein
MEIREVVCPTPEIRRKPKTGQFDVPRKKTLPERACGMPVLNRAA